MSPGFSLIEVVIALLLMAFGMLGLVNGLLSANQHAMESLALAQADVQAQNIYESMQANMLAVHQGSYYQSANMTCNPCNPAQQAAKDLLWWQQHLAEQLISGEGTVGVYGEGQKIMINWHSVLSKENISLWELYAEI